MTVASECHESSDATVKVAVRVRPQNARERVQMNQICASVTQNEPQIYIGKDKAFTYDYVFNILSKQEEIFNTLAKPLIDGCLEGYNATILAYGQTGSGKTFTMGSGFDVSLDSVDVGIIPRGVQYLFNKIDKIRMDYKKKMLQVPDFKIVAQFLELYNEELIDLLDIHDGKDKKSHIKIHENTGGSIYLTGVSTRLVSSLEDTLKCLKDGTLCRSTASTNMNSASSRSHAIFTLHIKQQRLVDSNLDDNLNVENETDYETLTAKFHFVDLAGSERLKRTGATGERAKEGISINCGLLALGNVISTLGDKAKRGGHVPYRNSKLTRLLQDSLGGNSQTIMIACISPSDCDFLETLNTLNYANRARNIKNKLTVNQDKTSKQLAAMRMQIESLQAELLEYQQGKKSADSKEDGGYSDIYTENNILQSENQGFRIKIKALSETIESLKARNAQVLAEKEAFNWQIVKQNSNCSGLNVLDIESDEIMKVIEKYTLETEELRARLAEAEAMVHVLQRSNTISSAVEFSKHTHVSMSGEFPEEDALFDSTISDWDSFIVHPKRRKTKKSEVGDNENGSTFICSISETGDTLHQVPSGSSDVDKDSLNGDAEEVSNAEDSLDDDDESEAENQDAENYLHQSLATLSSEIDVKKRLINELQTKQKQLKKIREHYESQLEALQNKIKETEHERDQVLANLGEVEVTNEERVRKVKNEYERKLSELKSELNQLQTAKREHTIMLKNQQRKDHELRLLQKELNELKSMKVQLSKKLREEAKRTRVVETTRNKEIVQLRKEKRLADNQIRNLEQEKLRKNQILKRKQEEVEALRRRQHVIGSNISKSRQVVVSSHSNTPVVVKSQSKPMPKNHVRRNSLLAKLTRSKWNSIENALKKTIIRRHTINSFEQDMNTRVKEREKLGIKYQKLENRRSEYAKDGRTTDEIVYEMKNIKSQIESVQEEISECQSNILEVEESQLEESVSDIIVNCSLDEAQYLLEQVYQLAVNKGILAQTLEMQENGLKFQLETRSQEREQALDMLRIALQHSTVPFDMDGIFANESDDDEDCEESPVDTDVHGNLNNQSRNSSSFNYSFPNSDSKKTISKRKPATPEELLGVNKNTADRSSLNFNFENNNNSSLTSNNKRIIHTVQTPTETSRGLLVNNPDAWKDMSINNDENKSKINNFVNSKSLVRRQLTWKHPGGSMTTSLIVSRNNTDDDIQHFSTSETPPASPLNFRRVVSQRSHNQENVFKRLTSTRSSPNPTKGTITSLSKKNPLSTHVPLQCISIAEGHQKPILDLDVSENILLTGSKDRCAKIWDLNKFVEISSLAEHQNSVTKVRISSLTNLAFTVCTFYIKMWDIRDCKKCIKTLWSSGLSQDGPPEFSQTSRQTVCPPGENYIMDIAFSNNGNTMFLATANSVKLWDMRRCCAVGKLHGNHQAPVMVLAASDKDRCSSTLVTGSKDHYIKVFEVSPGSVGLITPSIELQPPHYDGVESLALNDQILLSGSRDACIKKWDLTTSQPVASFSQAHRDWIQALCFTSDKTHFLSGCRSGVIKLWSTENCAYIGDVQAHDSGITALKSSSDRIFSASRNQTWSKKNLVFLIQNQKKKSNEIFSNPNVVTNQRSVEIPSEKKLSESDTFKLSDCVSHKSLNSGILSSSSQLCTPLGIANSHFLQQFQNNPQYFSFLNIPNESSIFSGCNMSQVNEFSNVGLMDDNQNPQSFIHR